MKSSSDYSFSESSDENDHQLIRRTSAARYSKRLDNQKRIKQVSDRKKSRNSKVNEDTGLELLQCATIRNLTDDNIGKCTPPGCSEYFLKDFQHTCGRVMFEVKKEFLKSEKLDVLEYGEDESDERRRDPNPIRRTSARYSERLDNQKRIKQVSDRIKSQKSKVNAEIGLELLQSAAIRNLRDDDIGKCTPPSCSKYVCKDFQNTCGKVRFEVKNEFLKSEKLDVLEYREDESDGRRRDPNPIRRTSARYRKRLDNQKKIKQVSDRKNSRNSKVNEEIGLELLQSATIRNLTDDNIGKCTPPGCSEYFFKDFQNTCGRMMFKVKNEFLKSEKLDVLECREEESDERRRDTNPIRRTSARYPKRLDNQKKIKQVTNRKKSRNSQVNEETGLELLQCATIRNLADDNIGKCTPPGCSEYFFKDFQNTCGRMMFEVKKEFLKSEKLDVLEYGEDESEESRRDSKSKSKGIKMSDNLNYDCDSSQISDNGEDSAEALQRQKDSIVLNPDQDAPRPSIHGEYSRNTSHFENMQFNFRFSKSRRTETEQREHSAKSAHNEIKKKSTSFINFKYPSSENEEPKSSHNADGSIKNDENKFNETSLTRTKRAILKEAEQVERETVVDTKMVGMKDCIAISYHDEESMFQDARSFHDNHTRLFRQKLINAEETRNVSDVSNLKNNGICDWRNPQSLDNQKSEHQSSEHQNLENPNLEHQNLEHQNLEHQNLEHQNLGHHNLELQNLEHQNSGLRNLKLQNLKDQNSEHQNSEHKIWEGNLGKTDTRLLSDSNYGMSLESIERCYGNSLSLKPREEILESIAAVEIPKQGVLFESYNKDFEAKLKEESENKQNISLDSTNQCKDGLPEPSLACTEVSELVNMEIDLPTSRSLSELNGTAPSDTVSIITESTIEKISEGFPNFEWLQPDEYDKFLEELASDDPEPDEVLRHVLNL